MIIIIIIIVIIIMIMIMIMILIIIIIIIIIIINKFKKIDRKKTMGPGTAHSAPQANNSFPEPKIHCVT